MSEQRIAILDASHSLFNPKSHDKNAMKVDPKIDGLVLQPIPGFREIVSKSVHNGLDSGNLTLGKIAAIEVGLICDAGGVSSLTKAIHAQVMESLKI